MKQESERSGMAQSTRPAMILPITKPRGGLELRPPSRLLRLLHMARELAAGVAFRPISQGNQSYLRGRIGELNSLGLDIAAMANTLTPAWSERAKSIADMLMNLPCDPRFCGAIIEACDRTGYKGFWNRSLRYVPAGMTPLVRDEYDRIIVATGPALGLGDEIACADMISRLRTSIPRAAMDIYSFYPEIWRKLQPAASIHTLEGNPMRVFDELEGVVDRKSLLRTLVLYINFGGLDFHITMVGEDSRPDIIEVSIARGALWSLFRTSSVVQTVHVLDPILPKHYDALEELSLRLTGKRSGEGTAVSRGLLTKRASKTIRVMLNPLTSKDILLSPADWANLLGQTLDHLPEPHKMTCWVVPGLTFESESYSRRVAESVTKLLNGKMQMIVMGPATAEGGADAALRSVYQRVNACDMILGIDTYTSHLASWRGVPSVSLCNWRTSAFWSAEPHAWWIEMRHGLDAAAELAGLMLSLKNPGPPKSLALSCVPLCDQLQLAELHPSPHQLSRLLGHGDAAWEAMGQRLRNLLTLMDEGSVWPSIGESLRVVGTDEDMARWHLKSLRHTHFWKICSLIARQALRK